MRRKLQVFVLLAACFIELAGASPAIGQTYNSFDDPEVMEQFAKKRRKIRRYVIFGVAGLVGVTAVIFIFLNSIDRSVARKAVREWELQRERNGLA
jgi:hypothetical protein